MILGLVVITALLFGVGAWLGAPYVPILRGDRERIFEVVDLPAGSTIIDLGSGDGRLLRAAAARGIHGIGYEINPLLVVVSWVVCWRYRHLVKIYCRNFWRTQLPPADAIYVFLIERYMTRLDTKLAHELAAPTIVVSLAFEIPGRTAVDKRGSAFVYRYEPLAQNASAA